MRFLMTPTHLTALILRVASPGEKPEQHDHSKVAVGSVDTPRGKPVLRTSLLAAMWCCCLSAYGAAPEEVRRSHTPAAVAERAPIKIDSLLRRAREARAAGHITEPEGASAIELYLEVLALDPGNREAKEAVVEMRKEANQSLELVRQRGLKREYELGCGFGIASRRRRSAFRRTVFSVQREHSKRALDLRAQVVPQGL